MCCQFQGENPFSGNQGDQDPEDSIAMDVSELELTNETVNDQRDDAPIKDELVAEREMSQEVVEGEAEVASEEKMEEKLGMEGEEKQQTQEEEGFEVGEEEEEEGYVVRDEIGEEGLQGEVEGEEVEEGAEVVEGENNE